MQAAKSNSMSFGGVSSGLSKRITGKKVRRLRREWEIYAGACTFFDFALLDTSVELPGKAVDQGQPNSTFACWTHAFSIILDRDAALAQVRFG
jgi:hypothetical protein